MTRGLLKKLIIAFFILLLIGAGTYYFIFIREKIVEIETAKVEKKDLVKTVSAPGKIIAEQKTTVYAPLTGTIKEILVSESQEIKEGDILAIYDKTPFDLAYAQAYSAYLSAQLTQEQLIKSAPLPQEIQAAQALINQTKEALAIARNNFNDNQTEINRIALDAAKTNYENALAQYDRLQSNYPTELALQKAEADVSSTLNAYLKIRDDLNKIEIKTPHKGTVLFKSASSLTLLSGGSEKLEEGGTVTAGEAIFTISSEDAFLFEAEVDETEIGKISLEQETKVELDSLEEEIFSGKVSFIAADSHESTDGETAYTVKVSLEEKNSQIKMGLTGDAGFVLETKKDVLAIPYEAVLQEETGDFVFVVNSDNFLSKRKITLGEEIDGEWEIANGLLEGETIAIGDTEKLKSGQKVKTE